MHLCNHLDKNFIKMTKLELKRIVSLSVPQLYIKSAQKYASSRAFRTDILGFLRFITPETILVAYDAREEKKEGR